MTDREHNELEWAKQIDAADDRIEELEGVLAKLLSYELACIWHYGQTRDDGFVAAVAHAKAVLEDRYD